MHFIICVVQLIAAGLSSTCVSVLFLNDTTNRNCNTVSRWNKCRITSKE